MGRDLYREMFEEFHNETPDDDAPTPGETREALGQQPTRTVIAANGTPSTWLNTPEGLTEHIAGRIAQVRDLEYRYRTVIEDPARAWFISPVTPDTIGVMRERHALYAAFVALYETQGAEAFIAAYEDIGNDDPQSLIRRPVRSYAATEETEKVDGPKSRRGERGDGGYHQTFQTIDDPIVLKADDPMVERQRNPPAPSKPLHEQTYAEYLEKFKASQDEEIQRYTKMLTYGLSRRLMASVKARLRAEQQAKPMTESEKERRGTEMLIETQARDMLSARNRSKGMKLIVGRLDWILVQIRGRKYKNKTVKDLCAEYKMPRVWADALKFYAVGVGRISEDEWKKAFKQPGRPKAVKPRGPYKTRVRKPLEHPLNPISLTH